MIEATPEAEREQNWLRDRRGLITGTDGAKIMRVSRWGGPGDVFADKMGIGEPKPVTKAQKRGWRRERLVLDHYADEENIGLHYQDHYTVVRHPSLPIGCTLDARRIDDGRPVDAKTVRYRDDDWGEHGTDEMPLDKAIQLVIQMACLNAPVADLPVEFTGEDYVCYRLHRDMERENRILDVMMDFKTKYLDRREPPPPDGTEGYSNMLRDMFPKHVDRVVVASPEVNTAAALLGSVKTEIALLELTKQEHEQVIKLFMGDAAGITGEGWKATWKTNKDGISFDHMSVIGELNLKLELVAGIFADPKRLEVYHGDAATALSMDLKTAYAQLVAKYTKPKHGNKPFLFELGSKK